MFYFSGDNAEPALQLISTEPLRVTVLHWQPGDRQWTVSMAGSSSGPVRFVVRQLQPGVSYSFFENGKWIKKIRSNGAGEVRLSGAGNEKLSLRLEK